MPNTVGFRYDHSLVAIRSKIFVIGKCTETCEVFDKTTNKFSVFKTSTSFFCYGGPVGATSIGNKIVIFGRNRLESTIVFYDTNKDEWDKKSHEHLVDHYHVSSIKMPVM